MNNYVFKVGAICLAFLIIGYQCALFVHKVTSLKIEAARDKPDTVYLVSYLPADSGDDGFEPLSRVGEIEEIKPVRRDTIRRNARHSPKVEAVRKATRRVESFRFNPNTVSIEDLQRLGFSEKQAVSIDNYRQKGGKFRRKSDFAKSFVVSDSIYRRLEKYIDIPLLDINKADSAAFDALPGIGPYFASRLVSYRTELGGYSYPEQMMDLYHFDSEKFNGLKDLIVCSAPRQPFRLWSAPADSLKLHPYIRSWQTARAIVLYRENNSPDRLTVEGLKDAGIVSDSIATKLSRCFIQSIALPAGR